MCNQLLQISPNKGAINCLTRFLGSIGQNPSSKLDGGISPRKCALRLWWPGLKTSCSSHISTYKFIENLNSLNDPRKNTEVRKICQFTSLREESIYQFGCNFHSRLCSILIYIFKIYWYNSPKVLKKSITFFQILPL